MGSQKLKTSHLHAILITILVLAIIFKSFRPVKRKFLKKKPNFTLKNPYSETQDYKIDLNYDKLVDINDFKFEVYPKKCGDEQFLLTVLVMSAKDHFSQRTAIRFMWKHTESAVKVVFLIGVTEDSENTSMEENIKSENNYYGDILQGNIYDTYGNLTYKHVMGLKWVAHHCNSSRYVLKTDDDTFINSRVFIRFLVCQMSPWGAQGLIAGIKWTKQLPERRFTSKFYVTNQEYALKKYPAYCSGGFILYSQDVIPLLLEASQTTKYFKMEDVFTTGILAANLQLHQTNLAFMYLHREFTTENLPKLVSEKRKYPHAFGPFNLSPKDIYEMCKLTK